MNNAWLKQRIIELTNEAQLCFANWQRALGAKYAYQEMLTKLEEEEALKAREHVASRAEEST